MFVWSKFSAAAESDAWEESIRSLSVGYPVITAVPGKPTIRLEVYCDQRRDADAIQKQFGGSIRVLKKQNWAALSPPPPDPIKVRDRLVIIGQRGRGELAKAKKKFPGREILSVPPEMAFGTGHHATTATVLRFIADAARQWQREERNGR